MACAPHQCLRVAPSDLLSFGLKVTKTRQCRVAGSALDAVEYPAWGSGECAGCCWDACKRTTGLPLLCHSAVCLGFGSPSLILSLPDKAAQTVFTESVVSGPKMNSKPCFTLFTRCTAIGTLTFGAHDLKVQKATVGLPQLVHDYRNRSQSHSPRVQSLTRHILSSSFAFRPRTQTFCCLLSANKQTKSDTSQLDLFTN